MRIKILFMGSHGGPFRAQSNRHITLHKPGPTSPKFCWKNNNNFFKKNNVGFQKGFISVVLPFLVKKS